MSSPQREAFVLPPVSRLSYGAGGVTGPAQSREEDGLMISGQRVAAFVASAPLVLLGACSDDPADGADPSEPSSSENSSESQSASGSPSDSPSAEPTKKYPEDKPVAKISAEKVATLWVEAYNEAIVTGDTTRMRHIASSRCKQCASFADQIDEYYDAGGGMTADGVAHQVRGTKLIEATSPARVIWVLKLHAAAGTSTKSAGADPTRFKAKNFALTFIMSARKDRWIIADMGFAG